MTATVATIAALISAAAAAGSFWWSREVGSPTITLQDTDVAVSRPDPTRVVITFGFGFKNTGRDAARIEEFRVGHYSEADGFEEEEAVPVIDIVASEDGFSYQTTMEDDIPAAMTDEQLGQAVGNMDTQVWALRIVYAGQSYLSPDGLDTIILKKWEGGSTCSYLTAEEYEELHEHLPEEFQRERWAPDG